MGESHLVQDGPERRDVQCDHPRSAFTPGPWVSSKFGFQVLTGDSWNTICTLKGTAEWQDGRGKRALEYEWQNQEANARLIAAAPELLDHAENAMACLRHVVDRLTESHYPQFDTLRITINNEVRALKAAIARAGGRP